ncbi:class I SAM-dependent methyltransferase [Piscinibacter koreensis]|uniref:Methyltransferase domain-containing protein n=1 Tax=Piscinibacter koreensis TaxID=2742824 RepID=A0A7Y6NQ91_9BURK|nr:methyltransferase domain-containing protein [Schlegelella koreensis]NUZ07329.1 methyltransferase domain-containing protein [Schlegelella koreensis]
MTTFRRRLLTASAAALLVLTGCAQPAAKPFEPTVGQAGKDVIWVPTPDAVVERMLELAQVKSGDRVVDLGSGDGKIAIAAAKRGARARGIEFNPDMVALSKRNAQAQGVQVDFRQGDIFASDFSDADVITLYLLPHLNEKLRPILLDMKPGTRVTSHQFQMGDWKPDRTDDLEGRQAHLWIVPAKVAGRWSVRVDGQPELAVHLVQRYQALEGHLERGGSQVPLQDARVEGPRVSFAVPQDGGTARFQGSTGHGGPMEGTVTLADGTQKRFIATRP